MSDKEICKEFLEKLLEIEIEKVELPENQKVIDLLLESKGIRLDIYVKDENNTVYNVEMQRGKHKNLPKSYIIFICTFDLFGKGRHKYTFETVCKEDNSLKLEDETNSIKY